ncbi:hypothetical protein GP486_003186 [Trichoglossum hirsutum]|uniref:SPRY domain-containing protein n=1 Tax=Trichoglossum hirsutum TaxID=265104 RepID=A0A9P8RRE8_9PEZI|nr:hypothetical protein GP486_003186 [Trichoglossum hirsutum]
MCFGRSLERDELDDLNARPVIPRNSMASTAPPPYQQQQYVPTQSHAPPPPDHEGARHADSTVYHDWTSIPDTSLLPPPPALRNVTSPTSNAEVSEADRALEFCDSNPLWQPRQLSAEELQSIRRDDITLSRPAEYFGELRRLAAGIWKARTQESSQDSCLLSILPLYSSLNDSPLRTGMRKTIYFELRILSLGRGRGAAQSSLAIGFCAQPQPTWRLPGWERGSLGIHGDDGRRYVNDSFGGKDFTHPFEVGDVLGVGMTFSLTDANDSIPRPQTGGINAEVFLTRNGKKEGEWDIHEELDAELDKSIEGLDGVYDLYAAIGTYGGVEFEAYFKSKDWLWVGK